MKLKKLMKLKEVVGIAMECAVYLTFYWVFRVSGWICGGSTDGIFGSIFDLFLDAALLVRDVFQRTFQKLMGVLDPFLGRFLTVHLPTMGFMCLAAMVGRGCMCLVGVFQV
jgi:hypothetical protein